MHRNNRNPGLFLQHQVQLRIGKGCQPQKALHGIIAGQLRLVQLPGLPHQIPQVFHTARLPLIILINAQPSYGLNHHPPGAHVRQLAPQAIDCLCQWRKIPDMPAD